MRTLILGQGSIGRRHARVLAERLGHSVSVVTRQEAPGLERYPTLADAGDLARFDYFVIATATHLHHPHLLQLDREVRDRTILVEKPLFSGETGYAGGRNRVFVGYQLRFHPVLDKVRELLAGRTVVAVTAQAGQYLPWWRPGSDYRACYSARRREGGGVVLDLSHELDYLQWLFGPMARLASLVGHLSDLDIDSDDYCGVLGETDRGVAVSLTLDYLSMVPVRTLLARALDATVLADLGQSRVTACTPDGRTEVWEYPGVDRDQAFEAMHRAILEQDGRNVCTLEEGLAILRTARLIQAGNLAPGREEGTPC